MTLTVTLNGVGTTIFYHYDALMKENRKTHLLTALQIRDEFGLGRETAYALTVLLPHAWIGRNRVVRREDVEHYLDQAVREGRDIRREALAAFTKKHPARGEGGVG